MKIGSPEHRDTFCKQFMQTYTEFDPDTLPWPDLDEESLTRLKSVPFWEEVFYTERRAGAIVAEFVKTIAGPGDEGGGRPARLRGSPARQADPRHDPEIQYRRRRAAAGRCQSDNVETRFKDFGFGECMDSFLGFGVFKIAMQSTISCPRRCSPSSKP